MVRPREVFVGTEENLRLREEIGTLRAASHALVKREGSRVPRFQSPLVERAAKLLRIPTTVVEFSTRGNDQMTKLASDVFRDARQPEAVITESGDSDTLRLRVFHNPEGERELYVDVTLFDGTDSPEVTDARIPDLPLFQTRSYLDLSRSPVNGNRATQLVEFVTRATTERTAAD